MAKRSWQNFSLTPEVWGGICGYGVEEPALRGIGRAAGWAVYAFQGYHLAHPAPEHQKSSACSTIRDKADNGCRSCPLGRERHILGRNK